MRSPGLQCFRYLGELDRLLRLHRAKEAVFRRSGKHNQYLHLAASRLLLLFLSLLAYLFGDRPENSWAKSRRHPAAAIANGSHKAVRKAGERN